MPDMVEHITELLALQEEVTLQQIKKFIEIIISNHLWQD